MEYYHGTNINPKIIMKEGLRPDSQGKIFFTPNLKIANDYGRFVYRVIPQNQFEDINETDAFYTTQLIASIILHSINEKYGQDDDHWYNI